MNKTLYTLLSALLVITNAAYAQKAFDEGIIKYHVTLKRQGAEHTKHVEGSYTLILKGKMVRKELKLDNGYDDVVLMDGNNNTLYTLQTAGDKKYAIQHNMDEHLAKQKIFEGFTVQDGAKRKSINGYDAQQATVSYKNGTNTIIYYTKAWRPAYEHTFDRLPAVDFIPLEFDVLEENKKMELQFTIGEIVLKPIENACFKIGADYKIISYDEYKEINK
jgi:hypothetical protein